MRFSQKFPYLCWTHFKRAPVGNIAINHQIISEQGKCGTFLPGKTLFAHAYHFP